MGRKSTESTTGDPTAVNSSIALLQERFRELQRVKERRELMQRVSEPNRPASIGPIDPSEPSFHPQPRPNPRDCSLSLGLPSPRNPSYHPEPRGTKSPESCTSLWPSNASTGAAASSTRGFENHSDVDTSLHL
ncbi:hypothetical protein CDL15_Pgr023160 [Punica granatum]|uniref:Uncharacterized protein n=1 Tax=Punica granatum TaxID=22663 RepID=A0A218X4N3_PUNGR|nr:hypothetical protein CDL15_Pgr023160 [Punica granatum]PKI64232.1 hypothetical protein CRG98_015419 [Punica granatum]